MGVPIKLIVLLCINIQTALSTGSPEAHPPTEVFTALAEPASNSTGQTFGYNNQYTCHCASTSSCNTETGNCSPESCQAGWYGSSCQKQNVALNKPTSQNAVPDRASSLAVDGDISTSNLKCSDSGYNATPFWRVNLQQTYPIRDIKIYYRSNNGVPMLCHNQTTDPLSITSVRCNLSGQYIKFTNPRPGDTTHFMNLCEVQVYVCSVGTFGKDCNMLCYCANSARCSQDNGTCPDNKCQDGWMGSSCNQACKANSYGHNCSLKCNARNCKDSQDCDHVTGACVDGCLPGYQGDDCTLSNTRLVGHRGPVEGRVQVYYNSEWKNVCDDGFDDNAAKVVCRELGYLGIRTPLAITGNANKWFLDNSTDYWLDELQCNGTESSLESCGNDGWGTVNCNRIEQAGVKCYHLPVYLSYDGFVKVFHNQQWRSVCPQNFNWDDGEVICRSLGFQDSHVIVDMALPDANSSDPEFMYDFNCDGSETDLEQCAGYKRNTTCPSAARQKLKCVNGSLEDMISINCDNSSFNIEVDVLALRQLYPNFNVSDLRLGRHCSGHMDSNNTLILKENFQNCLTRTKEISADMLSFTNELVYVARAAGGVVHNFHWSVSLECQVSRHEVIDILYHPIETSNQHYLNNTSHFKSEINLYTDPLYAHKAVSDSVAVGDSLYVQVKTPEIATGLRMVLTDCYAKPTVNADRSKWYTLIKNGCEIDPSTHIIRYTNTETRFFFTAFDFPSGETVVDVHCNVRLCSNLKRSTLCRHGCHSSPGIIG